MCSHFYNVTHTQEYPLKPIFIFIANNTIFHISTAQVERFLGREDAERFARRHLGYVDMEAYLCEVGWVLLSAESEVMDCDQYWNGRQFTSDREKARVFSSYQETASYQKRNGLEAASMIDQQVFRRAQFRIAA